jgi:hypothetical protein
MAETTYDLVFRAELLPEGDGANARSTLARVLKLDDTRLQQLFSGGVELKGLQCRLDGRQVRGEGAGQDATVLLQPVTGV